MQEDKILIRSLREVHSVRTVSRFLLHLRETNGSINIEQGRKRKRTTRTE